MRYREKANGSIEIVTPMGTLTLSDQKTYSDTLKETENNWEEVLKAVSFERKDKRDILGSIRKNLLHAEKQKNAMALQHMEEISKLKDDYKELKLTFTAWKQEEHCKNMRKDDALKEAQAEVNISMLQGTKLKQAFDEELDRAKRRDVTIKDLERKLKKADILNSKQLATIE